MRVNAASTLANGSALLFCNFKHQKMNLHNIYWLNDITKNSFVSDLKKSLIINHLHASGLKSALSGKRWQGLPQVNGMLPGTVSVPHPPGDPQS